MPPSGCRDPQAKLVSTVAILSVVWFTSTSWRRDQVSAPFRVAVALQARAHIPCLTFSRAVAKQLPLAVDCGKGLRWKEGKNMATLDWSQCPAVESVPGRLSGAWVFRNTRMPVSAVFENLEAGATIEDIIEQFDITREQISAVLEFAARSLDPVPAPAAGPRVDARSL